MDNTQIPKQPEKPLEKSEFDVNFKKHYGVLQTKITKFLSETTEADTLIIKAHLLCEYYVNQLIILSSSSDVKTDEDFKLKIDKVLNTSNPKTKGEHSLLSKLNQLRNRVGHELEYQLSESDVDSIGHCFGKEYIVDKYDEDADDYLNLLRRYLIKTVVKIAMDVMLLTIKTKEEIKKDESKYTRQ